MKKKVYLYSFLPILLFLSGGLIELDFRFALWFFALAPPVWLITFPFCWLINYCLIKKAAEKCNITFQNKERYKNLVIKSTILCFIFDLCISIIIMVIYSYLSDLNYNLIGDNFKKMSLDLATSIVVNPLSDIKAILIMGVVISIVKCIHYIFYWNYIVKWLDIDESKKKKFALYTIIYTIPYYYFLPTKWLTFK